MACLNSVDGRHSRCAGITEFWLFRGWCGAPRSGAAVDGGARPVSVGSRGVRVGVRLLVCSGGEGVDFLARAMRRRSALGAGRERMLRQSHDTSTDLPLASARQLR